MVYLNDGIDAIDVGQALKAVSPQRREKALRYRQIRDRRLSLAAYLLLAEGLEKEYGIRELPEFAFGRNGKPFLAGHPGIHFNLSHCREAALCAIGGSPVGCDVESVPGKLDMDLCRRCFNDAEIARIAGADRPTLAFARLWTQKEAFLKLTGEGLSDGLPDLLCDGRAENVSFDTHTAPDGSYVHTVCQWMAPGVFPGRRHERQKQRGGTPRGCFPGHRKAAHVPSSREALPPVFYGPRRPSNGPRPMPRPQANLGIGKKMRPGGRPLATSPQPPSTSPPSHLPASPAHTRKSRRASCR